MAVGTTTGEPTQAWVRPYRRGWLNVLLDWLDSRPWPRWVTYAVLTVIGVVASNSQGWTSGLSAPGELTLTFTFWGVFPVALLWTIGHLDRVASASLDAFRPVLDDSDAEIETMRYELTTAPARTSALLLVVTVPMTLAYYLADPKGSGVDVLAPTALVLRAIVESLVGGTFLVLVYQLVRQVRQVRRVLARATVDLFAPGPLHAFSRLTARYAIALIVLMGASFWISPPNPADPSFILWAPWVIGTPVFAVAAFVYPLMGLHDRLEAEKERLQGQAEERLKGLLTELNHDVDGRDLARADVLNKTLASMLSQRDVLARLPTWPWSTGTLRGLVTAILLPLGLYIAQRALAQFVGSV